MTMNYTVLLWFAIAALLFWVFYTSFLEMSSVSVEDFLFLPNE